MSQSKKKVNQLEQLNLDMLVGVPIQGMTGRILHTPLGDLIDYCSLNYLGFDYLPELHENGSKYAFKWGSLVNTSRLEADAIIYSMLEKRVSDWLGAKESIMAHTITITGLSLIPKLVGKGTLLTDSKVHPVVYEACRLARDHGAIMDRFNHQDLNHLESKLKQHRNSSARLILVDGVYSISSEKAPVREMSDLCEKYDAWLYVDDAHGFGVLGRNPTESNSYGQGGRGIVDYFNVSLERIFYVSSFAKAFCTHYAFLAAPKQCNLMLRENSLQYIFSAPMSPYNVGVIHSVLDLNERIGDDRRVILLGLTKKFVNGLEMRNLDFLNDRYFPVIFWKIGELELMAKVAKSMYSKGVIAGLRAYPVVPPDECGIRFGLSAIHTEEQIQKTLEVIDELIQEFPQIRHLADNSRAS